MGVPPSAIGHWAVSDVMYMLAFYKKQNENAAKASGPTQVENMEQMAGLFGVSFDE